MLAPVSLGSSARQDPRHARDTDAAALLPARALAAKSTKHDSTTAGQTCNIFPLAMIRIKFYKCYNNGRNSVPIIVALRSSWDASFWCGSDLTLGC